MMHAIAEGQASLHENPIDRARGSDPPLICLFIMNLAGGGAERVVVELANGFVKRNYDVDLVIVNRVGSLFPELSPRVNVHSLDHRRTLGGIWRLRSYLEKRRPSVVFSHITHTNVASIIARCLSRYRPYLVVVEHSHISHEVKVSRGLARAACWIVPVAYRFADAIAVVAEEMRYTVAKAARLKADKIAVLYNPVVTPKLFRRAAVPPSHPWFAPGSDPVVLGAGRMVRQKNFPLLIQAFALLLQRRRARLVILGEGELRADLERMVQDLGISEYVDLPGFQDNPYPYMRRAGVFALSSDWEGLPGVLIEALACGCPVVATDCKSGPHEILRGGQFGYLVPPGDPQAFADALESALRDPGSSTERISRARQFSLEAALDRYLHVGLVAPTEEVARS
jgi:glycosyltransferase involved in cell wall biosynthesis